MLYGTYGVHAKMKLRLATNKTGPGETKLVPNATANELVQSSQGVTWFALRKNLPLTKAF